MATRVRPARAATAAVPLLVVIALSASLAAGGAESATRAAARDHPLRPAEEVRERSRAVLARPGYQTGLPGFDAAGGGAAEGAAERARPATGPGGAVVGLLALPLQLFVWVIGLGLLAAALLQMVTHAVRSRSARAGGGRGREAGADRAAAPAPAGPRVADAEAMARRGAYGEAVHLLLLVAIGALVRRRGGLPASLTSREVLAASGLAGEAREGLAELVRAAESWLFGGAALGEDDWRRSAEAFDRLSAAGGPSR